MRTRSGGLENRSPYPIHEKRPQGAIDDDLPFWECDIVGGILWKRFGSPIPQMPSETGTEHQIRAAIETSTPPSGKPEVVICLNDAPFRPKDVAEWQQAGQDLMFREESGASNSSTMARTTFATTLFHLSHATVAPSDCIKIDTYPRPKPLPRRVKRGSGAGGSGM